MTEKIGLEALAAEHFEPLIHEHFHTGGATLELVEVERRPNVTLPRAQRTNFSLLLRQTEGGLLATGSHELHHEQLTLAAPIFLQRVLPPAEYIEPGVFDGPVFFEALFN